MHGKGVFTVPAVHAHVWFSARRSFSSTDKNDLSATVACGALFLVGKEVSNMRIDGSGWGR
jgi:hypothetical protein